MKRFIFIEEQNGECLFYDRVTSADVIVPTDQRQYYDYSNMTVIQIQDEVENRRW